MLSLPCAISASGDASAPRFGRAAVCRLPGLEAGAIFGFSGAGAFSAARAREAAVVLSVTEGLVGDMGRAPCGFSGETSILDGDGGSARGLFDRGERICDGGSRVRVGCVLVIAVVSETGGAMVRMRFFGLRTVVIVSFSLLGSSS